MMTLNSSPVNLPVNLNGYLEKLYRQQRLLGKY